MSNTVRRELRAAIDASLAEGWNPPSEEIATDEDLLAAVREIDRLWREHDRLYADFELRGHLVREDEEEINRLWDRADELTELALEAPVSSMPGAVAMLRLLRKHALEREVDAWQELYPAAMDRVLAVLGHE